MVKSVTRRIILSALLLATLGAPVAVQTAAYAAAPAPTHLTISGAGIVAPLQVQAAADAALFAAVLDQVNWLRGNGQSSSPASEELGPRYTVVVFVKDEATQTYDLYPLASGGPRAFRPAKQPDKRRVAAAWFYGRLNMSETLRAAGVPLPEKHDVLSGGVGGGERVIPDNALDTGERLGQLFGDLRQLVLINAAVVLVITAGLAGITLLVRRRTR